MSKFKALFPWWDEEEDMKKDERTERAVEKGRQTEIKIRKLAESYRAAGLIVQELRQPIK